MREPVLAIVEAPIDLRVLEASVYNASHGGLVTFAGIVRERADDGRSVTGLSYEAHEGMATAEFAVIAREIVERFGGVRLAIVHRIGDLEIGDIAVAVVAAAVHRGAAFDACEYAIDAVKQRAAIWKKEHYTDGAPQWIDNACATTGEPSHDR